MKTSYLLKRTSASCRNVVYTVLQTTDRGQHNTYMKPTYICSSLRQQPSISIILRDGAACEPVGNCNRRVLSCGVQRHIFLYTLTNTAQKHTAFIFRVQLKEYTDGSLNTEICP
jgi:hypothetical protein